MKRKSRVAAAATTGVVAFGAASAMAFGVGSGSPAVAANTDSASARVPESVVRLAESPEFAQFEVRVADAKEVARPAGSRTTDRWLIVPAGAGACVSPGDGGLVCGTNAQLNAGRVVAVDRPLAPLKKDGSINTASFAIDPTRVAGLVPDGVTAVVSKSDGGQETGRARVESNIYEIDLDGVETLGSLEFKSNGGATVVTLNVHGK